jgi:regulator of protease activity HflC (stomatin/prohibitin superfamily)
MALIGWVIVILVIGFTVARSARGESGRGSNSLIVGSVIFAIVLSLLSQSVVFIFAEERAVIISPFGGERGYRSQLEPGLSLIWPFLENVERYPISKQTYTMSRTSGEGQISGDDSVTARTLDGQEIFIDASVIFSLQPSSVISVHIDWQTRYIDDLVRPFSRGVIRDAVSQFGVEEIVSTKRAELRDLIQVNMAAGLLANGIILEDFVLRNITFTPEYAASVEQKQIAEQQAQQAFFVVEQRKQEAEQARQQAQGQADAVAIQAEGQGRAILIEAGAEAEARLIQAEAEATALRMLGEAIEDNPDILTLEYIQKLAPNIQIMLLPSDQPLLLPAPALPAEANTPAAAATSAPTAVPTAVPTDTGGETSP